MFFLLAFSMRTELGRKTALGINMSIALIVTVSKDKKETASETPVTGTSPPHVSPLSRQCGILNISQHYRPPRPVTGIALLYGDGVCFL
jgi:hypothetical protein